MKTATISLAMLASLVLSAGHAKADPIFDNYTSQSAQYGGTQFKLVNGAATYFSNVAQNTTITGITILNHIVALPTSTANLQFLIYDETTSKFVYESALQSFQGDGLLGTTPTFKSSAPFSFTLLAGQTYDIGYTSDTSFEVPYATPTELPSYTQGGLTATASDHSFGIINGNPTSTVDTFFSRMLPIQLDGFPVVPVPASVILFGTGMLGVGARRFRRR
jgi:hypothetical protein